MWRRGFTLVELLVGIGIIAVLMGMLLPALGTARSNARTIRCLSILRSYHQANVLYHDRYGGWVPVKTGLPPADSRAGQSILPYMNWPWFEDFRSGLGTAPANQNHVPAALICPDSLAGQLGGPDGFPVQHSYGYNATGLPWYDGPRFVMAHRRGGQPADAIEFADGLDWILLESGADRYQGEGGPSQETIAYRHGGGCNVVYWDGHADRRPRAQVVANDRLWQVP